MPVPSTQDIRRALLEILEEHPQSRTAKGWMTLAEKHLGITASVQAHERTEFKNRITEALQYLTQQQMISNPSRSLYMITKKGQKVLDDKSEIADEKFDALPDDLDLTSDDAENTDAQEAPDAELDALPDELDLTGDDAENTDAQEAPDAELDALPDDSDLTSDDAPVEESYTPESPDLQDSQTAPENTLDDAENSLDSDSDTDTLNYIDEVDPVMPKDDLPADDFSTTEDFSSAVNQALNIEDVFERHNAELADKVLMRAAGLSPEMFAVFVTDLPSKMGYNAFQTARYTSEADGSSMIQGVILDPKAKNPIYIHADKLSPGRTVGRSDMHDFADELAEKGGTGIFATTGEFSEQAGIYAQDERIMLIDGKKLAGLMLANNFCVNVAKVFEVKELDEDSFSEYE